MRSKVVRLTPHDWKRIHDRIRAYEPPPQIETPPEVSRSMGAISVRQYFHELLQQRGILASLPLFCWLDRATGDDCFSHVKPSEEEVPTEFRREVYEILQKHMDLEGGR